VSIESAATISCGSYLHLHDSNLLVRRIVLEHANSNVLQQAIDDANSKGIVKATEA